LNRVLQQEIAVFGESRSGKTVLVSSFYGHTQEPDFTASSPFSITADNAGQHGQLYKRYLGMRDDSRPPEPTPRDFSAPYSFTLRLKDHDARARKAFDAVRLIWHDYPGEWWEEDPVDPEIAQQRIDTFKSLLGADVAILLVDGQRLLDNAGEEERYLKSLMGNFRTGLIRLKGDLLMDGPLVKFPRIWLLALSKADLLPDVNVFDFRDLIIGKVADELDELRGVIASMIDSPAALAVGEDFVRLSSAKFEPTGIDVTERIGLGLVLPMAAMLPLERHVKWVERKEAGVKLGERLLKGISAVASVFPNKGGKSPKKGVKA
jgi:hypothetical protein